MCHHASGHESGCSSLTLGSSGSGKSYAAIWDILRAAERGDLAIVVLCPHFKGLTWNAFQHLVERIDHDRILYDRFSDFEKVLPFQILQGSKGKNEFQRRSINDLKAGHIIEALSRRRDISNLIANPQTNK